MRFVHAPSSGGAVRVENMRLAYWTRRFDGARRIAY
jgi:cell wall-associated NlpC family hydrolase